jgi:hypothetical protein
MAKPERIEDGIDLRTVATVSGMSAARDEDRRAALRGIQVSK